MPELAQDGVRIIAPPMWVLLTLDGERIVPSTYAKAAKAAGLEIITWTLERSGPLKGGGGWYYQTVSDAIDNDGDSSRCWTCSPSRSASAASFPTGRRR